MNDHKNPIGVSLVASFSISLLLMLSVTGAVNVSSYGEPLDTPAYGFPLLWHIKGITSLSREVALGALTIDFSLYWMASYLPIFYLLKTKYFSGQIRRQRCLMIWTAVLIPCTAIFMGSQLMLSPEAHLFLDNFEPIPHTQRIHFGPQLP